jgi:riboflavin synthase
VFTGLVSSLGSLAARTPRGPDARLVIRCAFEDGALALGESIAVSGCCLTVASIAAGGFEADASSETLARTTIGSLAVGAPVNLERALRAGDRMGGHIVSGHVDGVGSLARRRPVGESVAMTFAAPAELARFVAEKGSIAVDGVSLTVNRVAAAGGDSFEVMIIPHTLEKTNLGSLAEGAAVNLEVDLVARYVARLLEAGAPEN